jgi:5'-methylthioadenosine phosphorylase
LKEELAPLHFVVPDQFWDKTYRRASTFFGDGIVAHVGFDRPVCGALSERLVAACAAAGVKAQRGGTYLCMEGPQFSTLAESKMHRQQGFDVIGMTNVTEAKLAREAEICYATLAMVTDFDCWHPEHDSVTVAQIIENLSRNAENARKVLRRVVAAMPDTRDCACGSALASALITDRAAIPAAAKNRLAPLVGKYLGK